MRRRGDIRLAQLAAVLVAAGVLLSVAELLALGRITPPVLALDVVAITMVPFGLLGMYVRPPAGGRPGWDGVDDGRGGLASPPRPPRPSGGLQFDWQRFEAEFRAYAQRSRAQGASGADDL